MRLRKGCLLVVEIYHTVFFWGARNTFRAILYQGPKKGLHDLSFEGRTYTNGVFYSVD